MQVLLQVLFGVITRLALKEIVIGMLKRVQWDVIAERLLTGLVVQSLEKIASMSSNELTKENVELIAAMLRGKRLKRADEWPGGGAGPP
jgi:hypothetical protein